jgi:hypothetical protein
MTSVVAIALLLTLPATGFSKFLDRVHDYVETHRRVAAGIEQPLCADPEELFRQSETLAAAIRAARPLAREGDIFTMMVEEAFRARLAALIRRTGIDVEANILASERAGEPRYVVVYGTLPWHTADTAWEPLFRELPTLPAELEYRFIGRHLVLVDIAANHVVDVLRDALPAAGAPAPAEAPYNACDVHPQMPACWM